MPVPGSLTTLEPYALTSDVEALNRARKLGEGQNPTIDDVQFYLEAVAAQINTVLLNKGYQLPIPETATDALLWLRDLNAKGALVMLEKASPTAPNVDRVQREYDEQLLLLREAEFSLDAPLSHERTRPRGPGLTVPNTSGLESVPFFTRNMRF